MTIVVGGGASGASTAARLRRLSEKEEIIILEATQEISIANCGLPYYTSDYISDRASMIVASPKLFRELLNIDVRLGSKVTSINRDAKTVKVNDDYELNYDNLVLALGAIPIIPPIKGIDNEKVFTVRTLEDADKIKAYLANNNVKNAVVIGGGFIGVEMAENFVKLGLNTTIVELLPQVLAPVDKEIAKFAENELRANGCNLILNDGVSEFSDSEILLNSGQRVPFDIVIMSIGVKPRTSLAKEAGLELGINESIKVNEFMQTSDPNIYAAGDSVEVIDFVTEAPALIPLAGPANRQGRIIADNIVGGKSTYKKSQGTAIVKVFNKTIAGVGKNEKQLLKLGISFQKNIIWVNASAGYYPNATPIVLKLLYTDSGKILGAQAAGSVGVDKRIDVIATIMRLNGTINDLIDSELCYAPPYSGAKDPVNISGMLAENVLKGYVKLAFHEDIEGAYLIDVRPTGLFNTKTIPGAVNIPATELRKRLQEVPKDKKVILFCMRGYTSYVASRILMGNGFDNVYSLVGGMFFYNEMVK